MAEFILRDAVNSDIVLKQKSQGKSKTDKVVYTDLAGTVTIALTVLGGSIPAKMAAKKDPVEALRSE